VTTWFRKRGDEKGLVTTWLGKELIKKSWQASS
jgi:hypothetical protein